MEEVVESGSTEQLLLDLRLPLLSCNCLIDDDTHEDNDDDDDDGDDVVDDDDSGLEAVPLV